MIYKIYDLQDGKCYLGNENVLFNIAEDYTDYEITSVKEAIKILEKEEFKIEKVGHIEQVIYRLKRGLDI